MVRISFVIGMLAWTIQCTSQEQAPPTYSYSLRVNKLYELPKSCDETSGLEYIDGNILSVNDKGNTEEVFVFSEKGKLRHTITLENAKNHDWEDISSNSEYVFVGDIGNNNATRKELTIYAFPKEKLSEKEISAQTIHFSYKKQTSFEKSVRNHPFDAEAMFALENELIIIGKDWTYTNTWLYRLPIEFGDTVHSLSPKEVIKLDGLITGADYNPDTQMVAFCGYKGKTNYLWLSRYENGRFLGQMSQYELVKLHGAQIEGITFKDDNTLIISSEITKKFEPQLWEIRLR
ncbi:MAG: hypothetical protein Q4G08_05815 [Capnocytophaga sp.]|nr:hypothetical protein [Capnocytophaga sp.]